MVYILLVYSHKDTDHIYINTLKKIYRHIKIDLLFFNNIEKISFFQ